MGKIERLRDITFIENDQLLETPLPNQKFFFPYFASDKVAKH